MQWIQNIGNYPELKCKKGFGGGGQSHDCFLLKPRLQGHSPSPRVLSLYWYLHIRAESHSSHSSEVDFKAMNPNSYGVSILQAK
jgi:hypothetical protein